MSEPPQVTLLDLDAAGIDLNAPCPSDFMQFVYDNSQGGYLTLWSHILSEPGGPARIQKWFNDGLEEYHSRTIQIQMAPPTSEKPSGENITEVTYSGSTPATAPPVVVDVPLVMGEGIVGETLNCTMGNWQGEPTSYAYAWASDGAPNGGTTASYTVAAGDAGKGVTCIVTATNNAGSTAAPPSNTIAIASTTAASTENRTGSRREYPKEDPNKRK